MKIARYIGAALICIASMPLAYCSAAASVNTETVASGQCYSIGSGFAYSRAIDLCGATFDTGGGYNQPIGDDLTVPRACIRAATSGCRDTLISKIKKFQSENNCPNIDPSRVTFLAAELLKKQECKKLLNMVAD